MKNADIIKIDNYTFKIIEKNEPSKESEERFNIMLNELAETLGKKLCLNKKNVNNPSE